MPRTPNACGTSAPPSCAGPEPLSGRKRAHPEEQRQSRRHRDRRRPAGTPAVVVPDLRAVLAAAVAGAGVTVLPTYLCAAELACGHLVRLLDVEVPPLNTLFLAVRPGTEENSGVGVVRSRLLMQARLW
ncbi:LysR substrate-binding domain-containing protein [Streptomyces sp. NPDC020490]|uniref:LysR substrate-binding domain-containing protein n=1 Tax=Streptomyces sp. NPDC020490 TaxID=3365078 RepID=UPI0037A6B267